MNKYKLGDRVRIINGIGALQDAMRGRIGTVARLSVANGVEYCHILIDGFDNPHEDDPTIMFNRNQLEPWQGDSEYNKNIAISRYIRYKDYLKHKTNSKYTSTVTHMENLKYLSTKQPVFSNAVSSIPEIKSVIYSDPATIVFWKDGTKTVVKCKNEKFDPEKGLAMAFSKKMLGNKGNYYNVFKKWLPEEKPSNAAIPICNEILGAFSAENKKTEDKCRNCVYIKTYDIQLEKKQEDSVVDTDFITFASASGVNTFFDGGGTISDKTSVVCIGEITAEALESHGVNSFKIAKTKDTDGIVETIIKEVTLKEG